MAIAVFRSLEGESLEDFSIRLAEKWRIGRKGLDNGVILVVFVEQRKLRLEVGYGLEGSIPDTVANQIIREALAPRFREGRYGAGLEAAVTAVYARVEGGPAPPPARRAARTKWPVIGFSVLLAVVLAILGMEAARSRSFVGRRGYTASRGGWSGPIILPGGWSGGGSSGSGGGSDSFSGGGGGFGGGGASGDW